MNLLFLVNPVSGSMYGRKLAGWIEQNNSIHGIRKQIVFTDVPRLRSQVHSLATDKDLVVICGGDGTVSAVTSCLAEMDTPPAVAVIPVGTGNDIARATGWLRVWQEGRLDGFWSGLVAGTVSPVDIWSFEGAGSFIAYAGIGLDAAVVRRVASIRKKFSGTGNRLMINFFYMLAGFSVFCRSACLRQKCRGEVNCISMAVDMPRGNMAFSELLLANIVSYAGGSMLSDKQGKDRLAMMADGLLETYIFRGTSEFFHLISGRCPALVTPVPPTGQSQSVDIVLEMPADLQLDGEWVMELSPNRPYNISRTRSIPFLIPPDNFKVNERVGMKDDIAALMERLSAPAPGSAVNRARIRGNH